jgi:hypothetical protein
MLEGEFMATRILRAAIVTAGLFVGCGALAQNKADSKPVNSEQSKKIKVKYKEKTSVDFSDALVEGSAKNPFMTMVSTRDQDFNNGFIKIRYNWHDALIMSTSGLGQ